MILFLFLGVLIPGVCTMLFTGKMDGNQEKMGIQVTLKDGTDIDGEEFVIGMAASELSYVKEEEALKAWMIVCRTNFLKAAGTSQKVKEEELSLDYISPEQMELSNGKRIYLESMSKLMEASDQTFGQVLVYGDKMIDALYHQVSIGKTVSSNEIYSVDVPYLVSVDSSQDVESQDYLGIKLLSYKECAEILSKNGKKETEKNCRKNLKISSQTENGYVEAVSIKKSEWTGEEWKQIFDLNSAFFYLENYEDRLRIVSIGKGHGMGMSLYGANAFARKKKKAEDILAWYYPGTQVIKEEVADLQSEKTEKK